MLFGKKKASDTSKHEGQLLKTNRGNQDNNIVRSAVGSCTQLTFPSLGTGINDPQPPMI